MTSFDHYGRQNMVGVVVFSWLLFAAGCSKEDPKEHLQKGVEYFNKGEYEKAILELKTSSQSDKNIAETYYYLALLDEKNRQYKAMIENLKKFIDMAPDHLEARVKLGKTQLVMGDIDAALEQADYILKQESKNLDAQVLKASVFLKQKKQLEAEAIIDDVLKVNQNHVDALMLKAFSYAEKENYNDALALINTAIKHDGKNAALRVYKIQLDSKNKDIDAVVNDYEELVSSVPDNEEYKIALARIYTQIGKKKEAEEVLKGLVRSKPNNIDLKILLLEFLKSTAPERVDEQFKQFTEQYKDESKALNTFASWKIGQKDYDLAKEVLNRVVELDKDAGQVTSAKILLAKLAFYLKDFEASNRIVEEILSGNSNFIDAQILLTRLLIEKKQVDKAIGILNKILFDQPRSEDAHILLGQAYAIKSDFKKAEEHFLKVLEVNPTNLQALTYLYDQAVEIKNFNYAQEIVDKALKYQPDNLALLEKLAKLHFVTKNWDSAEEVMRRVQKSYNPQAKNLETYIQGNVYQGQGECVKAIGAYKELVATVPGNYEILVNMARCYKDLNKTNDMLVLLNDLLSKDASNVSAAIVLSDLLVNTKQYERAMTVLTNLIDKNNSDSRLYVSLAKVKLAQGDYKAAIAIYKDRLKQNPGDESLLLDLASLYEMQKDYPSAVSTYEKILKDNPNADTASNNLASILSEHYADVDSLKKAVQLSEKFKNSKQPYYKDTYAWALIKQGDVGTGLDLLNQIITTAPNVPVFRYHLGVAHYKNGDIGSATAELKQALQLAENNGSFPDKKAAEDMLKEISSKKGH